MNTLVQGVRVVRKETTERRVKLLMASSIFGIVLSALSYGYFVSKTVFNVVERQKTQTQLLALRAKVGAMETQRVGLKNGVTVELAHSLGFKEVATPQYISQKPTEALVSLNKR